METGLKPTQMAVEAGLGLSPVYMFHKDHGKPALCEGSREAK
jgi:hypothetical protein